MIAKKKVAGVVAITHGLVSGMPIELHAGSPVTNLVNMYSPFGSGVGYRDGNDVHKVLLAESCLTSRGFKIEDFLDANGFLDRPKFIAYLKANKDGFQGQGLTHVERLLLGPEFFPQEVAVKSPLGKHCVENDVE